MGCMGMSMDDFCRCTPSEFYAAWDAWSESYIRTERGMWERARMQALCTLQPYASKKLYAKDIMQFPWDKEDENIEILKDGKPEAPSEISREEFMERYRKARERRGIS